MAKQSFWSRIFSGRKLAEDSAVQTTDSRVLIQYAPRGSSGTESYAGYPGEDYLQKMRGTQRADEFDKMRRSDSQVKMCLSAIKNPIRAATMEFEPGVIEGEPVTQEAKEDAALIKQIFSDMDQPLKRFISEATTICEQGFVVFEVTHKVVTDHPKFGAYNGIRSLGFRSQRTIERFNLDQETGKLASVSQYAYGDLQRLVDIPAEFLIVMNLDKEGSNYEGISLLRPAYGNYFRKGQYLKLNAIGIEKFAVPTPMAEVPEGKQNTEQFTSLIAALEAYTTHQSNYLTYPEGWKITLEKNAYDPQKVETSIDNEDRRMAKAFLANFLELGMNTVGSYALSNDLSDFFLSGVENVANEITDPINQGLIPALIKLNRGPRQVYPRMKFCGISDKAGKEFGELLKSLGDGKYLTPDDDLEVYLRRILKLPPRGSTGIRQTGTSATSPSMALAERIRLSERKRLLDAQY